MRPEDLPEHAEGEAEGLAELGDDVDCDNHVFPSSLETSFSRAP